MNPGLLDNHKNNNDQTILEDTQPTSCSTRYWKNRLIFDSCFNPYDSGSFIENFTQIQNFNQTETAYCNSFPGGYLDLFAAAMPSKLKFIGEIAVFLREEDLLAIKLQLYKLPASKRNFVVSASLLSCSSSSNLGSSEFLYRLASIWYDRDSKLIWVPDNTLTNWYTHESELAHAQQQKQRSTGDPQKRFDEFWLRLVKSWEYCCLRWGYTPNIQKVLSYSTQLCFRDRDDNKDSHGLSAFSDSMVSSPSPSSEKGWTMIGIGSASS